MRIRVRPALLSIGMSLIAFGLAAVSTRTGQGCMAEYRSPDWQIANSPLIVDPEIEKVEDGKVAGDQRANDVPQPPPIKPTVATVRITRILKGSYSGACLRVGSGPMRNCAMYEVHCASRSGSR